MRGCVRGVADDRRPSSAEDGRTNGSGRSRQAEEEKEEGEEEDDSARWLKDVGDKIKLRRNRKEQVNSRRFNDSIPPLPPSSLVLSLVVSSSALCFYYSITDRIRSRG